LPPPANALGVQPPSVKSGGADLAAPIMDKLVDLRVSLSVHAAAMAVIRFEDQAFAILDSDKFKIGGTLAVSMPTSGSQVVSTFTGEVVSIAMDQGIGGRHELVVTAFDKSHRLSGQTNNLTYLNQSRGDIVKKIAGRNGLTAKVTGGGASEPHLIQAGTDYAFLNELAESLGCEWYVDGANLHFRKRPATAGVTLTWADDLWRFQARYSAADAAVKDVVVRGWDPAKQKAVTGNAAAVLGSPSGPDLGSDAPLVAGGHSKAKSAFGKKLVIGSTGVRTAAEAEMLASSVARTLLGDGVAASGECLGNPNLKPGTMVSIANMGAKLSGKYYVTEVEHVFGLSRPLITRFKVAGARSRHGSGSRRAANGREWGNDGIVLGVVTNNNDPETQGRVKVKFPTLGDNVESTWARVSAPGAGKTRGLDFRPEVGDEVVVAFDRGDLRQAVVIGGLWSAKNKIVAETKVAGGKVSTRVIRSRVGHMITMSDGDSPADRHITIALADKKTVVIIGQEKIDVAAAPGKPIHLKAGQAEVTMTGTGDITLKGVNVTIEGKAKVAIKAPQIEIKAQAALKMEAAAMLEAKGAIVKVEASGIASVKGAMLKLN
jgi:uncharacterized protein involved in type VI secretion and phage assembly